MSNQAQNASVSVREETIVIPTYVPPPPDPNPMFLEKRVNQGASGRVYPNPLTDRLSNEKEDRKWATSHASVCHPQTSWQSLP